MIPFKLSKQKAIDKFLEMCKRKWFLPKNFVSEKHFDKLTGVYFPYWYVDEQRSAQMVAKGEKVRSWTVGDDRYTETKVFELHRAGNLIVNNVFERALKGQDRDMLQCVHPYDLGEAHPFAMSYLSEFRNPHYSVTQAALIGGGTRINPGEISLAHNGVLFLDELAEFKGGLLDLLRAPLEEHCIRLSRAGRNVTYPANFLLFGAMNPCSCGYYPDMQRCRCSEPTLRRYFDKVSQPIIDRIDICVEASPLSFEDINSTTSNESSADIRKRVMHCHELQKERFKGESFSYNSKISTDKLEKYCFLGSREKSYMENMFDKLGLTARTYHKILKVARTIADLDGCESIKTKHLNEAICYRSINEKFWGGAVS